MGGWIKEYSGVSPVGSVEVGLLRGWGFKWHSGAIEEGLGRGGGLSGIVGILRRG